MNKRFQRGDTIVEVMIAMAVLGLVLASAFAIANRSYATGINAQERTEALKIAESQVELLRIASNSTDDTLLDVDPLNPNRLFCIDPNGANLERVNLDIGKTVPDLGDLDPIGYPPGCLFGTGGRYYVSIQQATDLDSSGVPTGGKIFSIRVYWESIFGGLSNVVNHEYRTYNFEGAFSLVSPVITCNDLVGGAINIGDPLPCIYPPTCVDPSAVNIGGPLPCLFTPAFSIISVATTPFRATFTGTVSDRGTPISTRRLDYYPTATPAIMTSVNITSNNINTVLSSLQVGTQYSYVITAVNANGTTTTNGVFNTVIIPPNLVYIRDFNGSKYYLSNNSVTWPSANSTANSLGGHLVTISSAAENLVVNNLVSGPYIWIGLSDSAVEGNYQWVNGQAFSYSNWSSPVQPDNYTYGGSVPAGEDYIMMYTTGSGSGRWNDLPSWSAERYVVEFEL